MDESIEIKLKTKFLATRRRLNIDWIKEVLINLNKVNIQIKIGHILQKNFFTLQKNLDIKSRYVKGTIMLLIQK